MLREMTSVAVEAIEVDKAYGKTKALVRATLQTRPGITGILGPNGAGKTTLLRILATTLLPDAGRLELLGHDPLKQAGRRAIRRSLGYVPQEPGFYRHFTTFDFIEYIAVLKEISSRRQRQAEVTRVIDELDLTDVARRKIRALSGGMRRRVALAQALLGDPRLLILDEPTVGLDPEQKLRFRELISRLGENRTVLLSTHQTEDVLAICSEVTVINGGRTLFAGQPTALADVAAGSVWMSDVPAMGARLYWRTGEGRFRNIGAAPGDAELVAPSVEDGYLLLVGGDGAGEAA